MHGMEDKKMKNIRNYLAGNVILLCLLCTCLFPEAGTDDTMIVEEMPDEEKMPWETKPEKEEEVSENNQIPELEINELCTEYSHPRVEFIEFKIRSPGNLGGLQVFVVGNNKDPLLYEFEPVEVQADEYVVLHLRKLEESCKDEYGDNLAESGGMYSSPTARDFWIQGSEKLLNKTDIIYVLDQYGNVLSAVMIAENPNSQWSKDYFLQTADFLYRLGAWKSPAGTVCTPADAVNTERTSVTQTICRDETAENTHTAADWYITVTSGATPGKPNNPNRLKI
jgi:hypothetical protein